LTDIADILTNELFHVAAFSALASEDSGLVGWAQFSAVNPTILFAFE
jgi:hypothetical protein